MEKKNNLNSEALERLELIDKTLKTVRNNPQGPLTGLIFGGMVWLWITIAIVLNTYLKNNVNTFAIMGIAIVSTIISLGFFTKRQQKFRATPLSEIDLIAKHIFFPVSFSPVIMFLMYQGGASSFGHLFILMITNIAMIYGTCMFAMYCIYKSKLLAVSSFIALLSPVFYSFHGENTFLTTLLLCLASFTAVFTLYKLEKTETVHD